MATVYRAFDTRLERPVAIKVIRMTAFSPEILDQMLLHFEREAKALAKLSHHNIVKIYDFGEYQSSPYLVMEYLPGGTLKAKDIKNMPWPEAVRLLIPVAQAIAYTHRHNILTSSLLACSELHLTTSSFKKNQAPLPITASIYCKSCTIRSETWEVM